MEASAMSCPLFRKMERTAKRIEASTLSARCPASNLPLFDTNVDLRCFILAICRSRNKNRPQRIVYLETILEILENQSEDRSTSDINRKYCR
jgi:hypothetical protein